MPRHIASSASVCAFHIFDNILVAPYRAIVLTLGKQVHILQLRFPSPPSLGLSSAAASRTLGLSLNLSITLPTNTTHSSSHARARSHPHAHPQSHPHLKHSKRQLHDLLQMI